MIGWIKDLEDFTAKMRVKIHANMDDKQLSWKEPTNKNWVFLNNKLKEYYDAEKWVDVANIAFMLWDLDRIFADKVSEGKQE